MDENGERVELRVEAGRLRYYLAGKPIHAGDLLELRLDDGRWMLGRYEWNYRKEDWPWLYFENEAGTAVNVNPDIFLLRWPGKLGTFSW